MSRGVITATGGRGWRETGVVGSWVGWWREVHPGGDGREAGGIFNYSALSLAFKKKEKGIFLYIHANIYLYLYSITRRRCIGRFPWVGAFISGTPGPSAGGFSVRAGWVGFIFVDLQTP